MLGIQPVLDVVLVLDVEHAVLLDLHLGVAVHAPRRRPPDPPAVDVIDPAVARTEELPLTLRVHEPAHRAPEVGAGVGEDVDVLHQLLALLLGEPLALLVHEVRAQATPQLVADGALPARTLDLVPPGEPDGVRNRELLLGDAALFLDLLVPVGLGYGKLDREDHGLLLRDIGDRPDRLPVVGDVRLAQDVGLDDRVEDKRHGRNGQHGADYRPHHPEAQEVAPGHRILLQLRQLLAPSRRSSRSALTCQTRTAVCWAPPCNRADYIP